MKKSSVRPARKPVGRKAASAQTKAATPRASVTREPAQNLIVSENDTAAIDSIARVTANSLASSRSVNRRSAVDRLFYTTKRVGGGVQDFDAIKLMKFAVS